MEKSNKQLSYAVVAIAIIAIAVGAWFLISGESKIFSGGKPDLPKDFVVESPEESRNVVSSEMDRIRASGSWSDAEYEQIRKSEANANSGATASGASTNAQTIQSRIAELKKNGKEYLEDYLQKTYEAKGVFDVKKIQTLPLGDAGAFERFLATVSQFDNPALQKIGPALLSRTSFGLEFDENSLEGYLSKNYTSGNLDYAKMKELPIRNELGLLFLMTEIYYSNSRSIIWPDLEAVIAHKVSLIPKNNIINPRYQNLNRIYSFFQVAQGKTTVDVSRNLRESQLMYLQAGNYPLLRNQSDKDLFAEGSRLMEKYKEVKSVADAKTKDYVGDLAAGKELIAKMDASAEFKKYYIGITSFNSFLSALEILNGNGDAAVEYVKKNETYMFTDADGNQRPTSSLGNGWSFAIAYEGKGDILVTKGDKKGAKSAYESAKKAMTDYSFARPHYVLPREHVKTLQKKIDAL